MTRFPPFLRGHYWDYLHLVKCTNLELMAWWILTNMHTTVSTIKIKTWYSFIAQEVPLLLLRSTVSLWGEEMAQWTKYLHKCEVQHLDPQKPCEAGWVWWPTCYPSTWEAGEGDPWGKLAIRTSRHPGTHTFEPVCTRAHISCMYSWEQKPLLWFLSTEIHFAKEHHVNGIRLFCVIGFFHSTRLWDLSGASCQ